MRRALPLIALLFAAGCGQGNRDEEVRRTSQDLKTFDVAESSAPPPPGVGPTAAPGVAFNYRYAFRLPNTRISAVQEQHAVECEKLGIDRCRITGMRYRVVGEEDIEAMLALKLDPAIARRFGKSAIDAVTRTEGMLVDAEITGTDVGGDIQAANRSEAELNEDLARIERQLSQRGISGEERAQLQAQAQQVRESLRANRSSRIAQQASLATTPMTFEYGSGDVVAGFDSRSPFTEALRRAGENFVDSVAMLFVLLITLLPWALIVLLVWWLFRKLRRRFGPAPLRAAGGGAEAEPQPPVGSV